MHKQQSAVLAVRRRLPAVETSSSSGEQYSAATLAAISTSASDPVDASSSRQRILALVAIVDCLQPARQFVHSRAGQRADAAQCAVDNARRIGSRVASDTSATATAAAATQTSTDVDIRRAYAATAIASDATTSATSVQLELQFLRLVRFGKEISARIIIYIYIHYGTYKWMMLSVSCILHHCIRYVTFQVQVFFLCIHKHSNHSAKV